MSNLLTSPLLDKKQAAALLHCSVSKIEKMMHAGTITFKKIGALVRFRPCDLEPFFEGDTGFPKDVPAHTTESQVIESTHVYESVRRRP